MTQIGSGVSGLGVSRIGGLQKHSFIDYPGKISCVLFLAGCNFSCPYCHNPQLVGSPGVAGEPLTIEDFLAFLAERRGLLEGVVISGGNPRCTAICRTSAAASSTWAMP